MREHRVGVGGEQADSGDDGEKDQDDDQAVFNGGRAPLTSNERP